MCIANSISLLLYRYTENFYFLSPISLQKSFMMIENIFIAYKIIHGVNLYWNLKLNKKSKKILAIATGHWPPTTVHISLLVLYTKYGLYILYMQRPTVPGV